MGRRFHSISSHKLILAIVIVILLVSFVPISVATAQTGTAYVIVHAHNPEGIEIASIIGIGRYSHSEYYHVPIYDGDSLIGYCASTEERHNKPIAIPSGFHTITVKFNGMQLSQNINVEEGETRILTFVFERIEHDFKDFWHVSPIGSISGSGSTNGEQYVGGSHCVLIDQVQNEVGYIQLAACSDWGAHMYYTVYSSYYSIVANSHTIILDGMFDAQQAPSSPGLCHIDMYFGPNAKVYTDVPPPSDFTHWIWQVTEHGYPYRDYAYTKTMDPYSQFNGVYSFGPRSISDPTYHAVWRKYPDSIMVSVPYDLTGTGVGDENQPPVAAFTLFEDREGIKYQIDDPMFGQRLFVDASNSYDPDGEIAIWQWDLGDGTTEVWTDADRPEDYRLEHVYKKPGVYTIKLTVTDNDWEWDETSMELDLTLKNGDLLLKRSERSLVPGFWTHIGIYDETREKVIEARQLSGVNTYPLEDWIYPTSTYVQARRVNADQATRDRAVDFAFDKRGQWFDPWSIFLNTKQWALGDSWYCSELVWAAYLVASFGSIDLDPDTGAVSPDEIGLRTELRGEHLEDKPYNIWIDSPLWGLVECPVDIHIIDPDDLVLNKLVNEIPDAIYEEVDIDNDGEVDDAFVIPERKLGDYSIRVIPEPDAMPEDTYSLKMGAYGQIIVLAENVLISNIPNEGYMVRSTETGVSVAPIADANGPYGGSEASPITFNGSDSYDPDGSIVLYEWDFNDDGVFDSSSTSPITTFTYEDDYIGNATLRVTDDEGLTSIDEALVTVNNVAPTVISIVAPMDPIPIDTVINTSGNFTDSGFLDTHTAEWNWGDSTTAPGTVNEVNGDGNVTGSHTYTEAGVYTVSLNVTDDDGGWDTAVFEYVVVYDPSAGFVTGGGWISSPEGAYMPDPTLSGKATFGFVSRYKKGATTPTGETEFQFKVADLNFHSTSYQWLVIAGPNAKYKGWGTINGEGEYGFMLTATDEKLTPSTDVDMFRIKIWDINTGVIIYDNKMGESDDSYACQEIGGGSIVIHKK